jgi:hypothetical protein
MRKRYVRMFWRTVLSIHFATLAFSGRALADDKQDCIAASEAGQDKKLRGSLREAREQLLVCARDVCPMVVRQDCTAWLTEIITALPSVVVGARDPRGQDLVDVTVSVDGTVVASRLDGKPIDVDPGVHTFRYALPTGAAPVEERVVIRQGERNRTLTVNFGAKPPSHAAPASVEPAHAEDATGGRPNAAPGAAPESVEPARDHRGLRPYAYVAGAVGAAGVITFAIAGLLSDSAYSDLRSQCGNGLCPLSKQSEASTGKAEQTAANVGLGVGLAGLAVGATVFVLSFPPKGTPRSEPPASASAEISFAPGWIGVRGRF